MTIIVHHVERGKSKSWRSNEAGTHSYDETYQKHKTKLKDKQQLQH